MGAPPNNWRTSPPEIQRINKPRTKRGTPACVPKVLRQAGDNFQNVLNEKSLFTSHSNLYYTYASQAKCNHAYSVSLPAPLLSSGERLG